MAETRDTSNRGFASMDEEQAARDRPQGWRERAGREAQLLAGPRARRRGRPQGRQQRARREAQLLAGSRSRRRSRAQGRAGVGRQLRQRPRARGRGGPQGRPEQRRCRACSSTSAAGPGAIPGPVAVQPPVTLMCRPTAGRLWRRSMMKSWPLGLRAMPARIASRSGASLSEARKGPRRSTASSCPRHMYIVPVQVTRTRLQDLQKLWVRGVMKPSRPPVSATST